MVPVPPTWADTWLRLLLPARDVDTVSGDLMEEYRDNIRPRRSQLAADAWYLGQVSRFAWRIFIWAVVLTILYTGRMSYDWFVPTSNFAPRAEVTTLAMVSTLLVIGASSTLRTRSVKAGVASTASALVISAILSTMVLAFICLNWKSPELISRIGASGGMGEAFTMPIVIIVPGTIVGAMGALFASFRLPSNPRSTY